MVKEHLPAPQIHEIRAEPMLPRSALDDVIDMFVLKAIAYDHEL